MSRARALLVSRLRAAGRRVPVNDSWIGAAAIAHGVPVMPQDSDYDAMPGIEGHQDVTRALEASRLVSSIRTLSSHRVSC